MPFWDVHFKPGFNKARLVNKREVDVTEEVNNSVRATLQKQLEVVVGKIILANPDGSTLPLIETLLSGINIKSSVAVKTKTVVCPEEPLIIPGIVSASAYTADDCFGTQFTIDVPKSGEIHSAKFWDLDDENSQVDFMIFKSPIVQIADHDPWAPTDNDMLAFITALQFAIFVDHTNSRTASLVNIGEAYYAPDGKMTIQAVTRSTPNIAAGQLPRFQMAILSDDPDWSN